MTIWICAAVIAVALSILAGIDEMRQRRALARELLELKKAADSWNEAKKL